ncbi:hypothetical protein [Mesorhizobium sp. CN2-181]|uniref:hypothetical protein n=1 Tax=Mesorhizobium yinganensis TaxID=3157707 RepID=UPI0032B7F5C7
MKIADLFRRLSYGQLSNLSISNNGSGEIVEAKHPQMIQYANEALLNLYTRFVLKEKNLLIQQVEGITSYHLERKFAETSGSDAPHRYIKDLPDEPFMGDSIRILAVYDEFGRKMRLNDQEDPASLFTPSLNELQIPRPEHGRPLGITYQARHPELDDRPGKIINQEIILPFIFEAPLQNFIGYLTYCHMNGQENIVKGQEYLGAYEAKCVEVEQRDLVNQTFHTSQDKLDDRGFV